MQEIKEDTSSKYSKAPPKFHKFGKDPMRYFMGILYSLQCLHTGLSTNPLTAVSVGAQKAYDIDDFVVNLSTSLLSLASMIVCIPTIMVIRKVGIDISVKVAFTLIALGFMLRTLVN